MPLYWDEKKEQRGEGENGKWEMGNGKWAMGNGKWEKGNGKWKMKFGTNQRIRESERIRG